VDCQVAEGAVYRGFGAYQQAIPPLFCFGEVDAAMKLPQVKLGQSFRVGATWYRLVKRNDCSATVQIVGKTRTIRYEVDGEKAEREISVNQVTRIATNSEIDEVET
jgi:hypothetical protein